VKLPPEDVNRRFSLEELSGLTGLPARTIRFYIQEGVVDRPEGIRRGAWYHEGHLEQLLAIRRWQAAGLSLDRIRELVGGTRDHSEIPAPPRRAGTIEVLSHLVLGEGIDLVIDPARAGLAPAQLRELAHECALLVDRVRSSKESS
jgi:DNA-binding transcriptional MerR regulator